MTVKELISILEDENPDAEVLVASDAEGNDFETLHTVEDYFYRQDRREIELIDPTEVEDEDQKEDPAKPCVVLWP